MEDKSLRSKSAIFVQLQEERRPAVTPVFRQEPRRNRALEAACRGRYAKSVISPSAKRGFTCLFGHLNSDKYVAVNALSRRLKPERRTPAHVVSCHANRVENSFCVYDLANLGHGTGSPLPQSV
jgi:hypothetical protein